MDCTVSPAARQAADRSSAGDRALLMHQLTRRPAGNPPCPICGDTMLNDSRYYGGRGYVSGHTCDQCRHWQEVRR